jgi:hypothetical protein
VNVTIAAARTKLVELREKTLADIRPHARRVLATLTAEQRKTIEDAARARGKTLDEDRLETITARLLARTHAGRRAEARTQAGRRAETR